MIHWLHGPVYLHCTITIALYRRYAVCALVEVLQFIATGKKDNLILRLVQQT